MFCLRLYFALLCLFFLLVHDTSKWESLYSAEIFAKSDSYIKKIDLLCFLSFFSLFVQSKISHEVKEIDNNKYLRPSWNILYFLNSELFVFFNSKTIAFSTCRKLLEKFGNLQQYIN